MMIMMIAMMTTMTLIVPFHMTNCHHHAYNTPVFFAGIHNFQRLAVDVSYVFPFRWGVALRAFISCFPLQPPFNAAEITEENELQKCPFLLSL